MIAPYPTLDDRYDFDLGQAQRFAVVRAAVTAVRTIRSEFSIAPDSKCAATIVAGDAETYVYCAEQRPLIEHLSKTEIAVVAAGTRVTVGVARGSPMPLARRSPMPLARGLPMPLARGRVAPGVAMVTPMCEVVVHILDEVDREAQLTKVRKEHTAAHKRLQALEKRLAPDSPFCAHAKPEVIASERARLTELRTTCATLTRFIRDLT